MKLDSNAHSVFLLYYHLVLVVKYRRRVFDDDISNRAKEIFEYIAPNYNITLQEWNHDKDHVHILFKAHPKTEISKYLSTSLPITILLCRNGITIKTMFIYFSRRIRKPKSANS